MRKIICFTDSLGAGGAQRQLAGLACMLKDKGYDVEVVLYYDNPFYKSLLDESGVVSMVISNGGNYFIRVWELYKYFRRNKNSIIIAFQETPSVIACFLRPFIKCGKLIVSERNTTQQITLKDRVRFILWRFADIIVPNSHSQANFIRERIPSNANKVVTITNFVDTDVFVPLGMSVLNSNKVLVVASDKAEKNFKGVVEAVKILKQRNCQFHLNWYGIRDSVLTAHRNIIIENEIDDVMSVYEPSKNIREAYLSSDFFCLASFWEGFPNVLCEAMSCGLPVVSSDVCDNPYIVKEGENGFLFNPYNPTLIADSIEKLLNLSESERSEISLANRKFAEENLSKEAFLKKYLDIIE